MELNVGTINIENVQQNANFERYSNLKKRIVVPVSYIV